MLWRKAASGVVLTVLLVSAGWTSCLASLTPSHLDDATETAILNVGASITSSRPVLFIQTPSASGALTLSPDAVGPNSQFFVPRYLTGMNTPNLYNVFALYSVAFGKFITAQGSTVSLKAETGGTNQMWYYDGFGRITSFATPTMCLSISSTLAYPSNAPLSLAKCTSDPLQMWLGLPKVPGSYNGTIKSLATSKCLDATFAQLRVVTCGEGLMRMIQTFVLQFVRSGPSGSRYYRLYNTWSKKYVVFSNGKVDFVASPTSQTSGYSSEWTYNSRGQFRSAVTVYDKNCLQLSGTSALTIDPLCKNSLLSNRWLFSSP